MHKHPNLTHPKALQAYQRLLSRVESGEWPLYSFDKSYYYNWKTNIMVTCNVHGIFNIIPHNLIRGSKCPKCAREHEKLLKTKPKSKINAELLTLTGGEYILSGDYNGMTKKNEVTHTTCGTTFTAYLTNTFRTKAGCPKCSMSGFDITKSALLYYVKINFGSIYTYKIGVTNRLTTDRFSAKDLKSITILKEIPFKLGKDAYKEEQRLLKLYSHLKYKGEAILKDGNTEIFTKDISLLEPSNSILNS